MRTIRSLSEMREWVDAERAAGHSIGFVPTMGALHEGHLSLIRLANAATDRVVVSIFVNPLQFGPGEDLDSYPRTEARDLEVAGRAGAAVCYVPTPTEVYPTDHATTVTVRGPATGLEGALRPGHFDGVATVVSILFHHVTPDAAWFGQKDAQQVAVVRRLAADLSFRVRIEVGPTVRDRDGLALSSRNAYLSPEGRRRAAALFRALEAGAEAARGSGPGAAGQAMRLEQERSKGVSVDYAEVVDPASFGPPKPEGPWLLVVAARVDDTRLIDNLLVESALAPDPREG